MEVLLGRCPRDHWALKPFPYLRVRAAVQVFVVIPVLARELIEQQERLFVVRVSVQPAFGGGLHRAQVVVVLGALARRLLGCEMLAVLEQSLFRDVLRPTVLPAHVSYEVPFLVVEPPPAQV